MIRFFRVLLKLDPPMGTWIYYEDYVLNWRGDWADKVRIVDYHPTKQMIKLELL